MLVDIFFSHPFWTSTYDGEELLTVDYSRLTIMLLREVQELKRQLAALQ
jgi:hypothetical protein